MVAAARSGVGVVVVSADIRVAHDKYRVFISVSSITTPLRLQVATVTWIGNSCLVVVDTIAWIGIIVHVVRRFIAWIQRRILASLVMWVYICGLEGRLFGVGNMTGIWDRTLEVSWNGTVVVGIPITRTRNRIGIGVPVTGTRNRTWIPIAGTRSRTWISITGTRNGTRIPITGTRNRTGIPITGTRNGTGIPTTGISAVVVGIVGDRFLVVLA